MNSGTNTLREHVIIAIDGHSSCGKSTLARDLAKALHYTYIDSGAMYRAVTLYFLRHEVDINDPESVDLALESIQVDFKASDRGQRTLLNGEDVEDEIRSLEVSKLVSPVAAISAVRKELVRQQREMGSAKGIIMDGRDIGTVVFPDAEIKLFVTADLEERINRRLKEWQLKGRPLPREEVAKSITERDRIDSTRADSPLRKADGAIEIDTTDMTREGQLLHTLSLIRENWG